MKTSSHVSHSMLTVVLTSFLLTLGLSVITRAQSDAALSASDKTFVQAAAEGGLAEVELGKLATEKASSDDVKKFGQRMVDDHSKANGQLKQIASMKGISVPRHAQRKRQDAEATAFRNDWSEF